MTAIGFILAVWGMFGMAVEQYRIREHGKDSEKSLNFWCTVCIIGILLAASGIAVWIWRNMP